jgi:hypothetical protein
MRCNIPVAYTLKPYKQVISYDKKILKITNYFDGSVADENYSMMIDLIEKKAKLEVNENEPYNNNLIKDANKNQTTGDDNKNLNAVGTNNPTVSGGNETEPKTNTNKNVTNEQLLSIAKMDAKEASDEATKLKQEAQDAFGLATQKTAESVAIEKEAETAIENANAITDVAKKNEELAKANQLKEDAKIASAVANTATNMAKKLEVDANTQQKEADLTNQYITQLETVIKNKNNKEALTKLESIQKELDDLSKQKNQSSELLTSLKAESELKQQELINSEKKNNGIITEINALKSETENLEKDLANENDKSIKENISAQIRELNSEIDLKNKDLATNNQKIESLKNEVEGVNQELQIAAKILNEKTDGVAINNNTNGNENGNATSISNNNTTSNPNNSNSNIDNTNKNATALSYEGITSKYTSKINETPIDNSNKESIAKQNEILKTYNKDVNDLIALNKNELSKTTNTADKKNINDEIKKLEKLKIDNDKAIAANNSTINKLESNAIANNNSSTTTNSANINSANENNSANGNAITNENNNTGATNSNTIAANNKNNNGNENAIATNSNNATSNNSNEINSTSNNTTSVSANNINGSANNTTGNENNNTIANNNNAANENPNAINNNGNNTSNGNNNAISTNAPTSNETIKPINPSAGTDNSAFLNELNNLKNGLNANSSAANQIFNYNDYKENTSVTLKQAATQKFDAAKQSEIALNNTISKTETAIKNSSNGKPETLLNEAEALNNKAFEQRKESATKSGAEKDALIRQATDNEKLSVEKKLEASVLAQKQNKATFENNSSNLAELQKVNGAKTSDAISQANMLVDEAALNFKQAQKLRTEADAYPSGAAKLGGLSNAEEKENEALAKQQKALDILSKANPTYQVKPLDTGSNPTDAIANVNNEITKTTQLQVDAYLALSKANQNELKLQSDKLAKNPAFSKTDNKQAQDLKATSDKLNTEAKAFIGQSLTAKTPAEKANLLLQANEKEIAAIKALSEATELTKNNTGAIAANNTNAANTNTVNATNANRTNNPDATTTNTVAASNNNATNTNSITATNNNAANTNSVATTNNNATITNSIAANNVSNTNENAVSSNSVASTNNNSSSNTNSNGTNSVTPNNEAATNASTNPTNTKGNGAGAEALALKNSLNNPNEANLLTFNPYIDSEAKTLKDQAAEKINAALEQDKAIASSLDNVNQLASNNTSGGTLDQSAITSILSQADKMNEDALALRKSSATKTGAEKDKDINEAKTLEATALSKKVEASQKQQQLNKATFEANKQSLEELAQMAKGKNIPELSSADMITNEANLFLNQAIKLREEANAYPSDGAKLGGYSNAEEKEFQALFKQQSLLDIYKKQFPTYVPKKPNIATENPEALTKLNETKNTLNTNNQAHVDGLTVLAQANDKEYTTRLNAVPATLTAAQNNLKTKAQTAFTKKQDAFAKANQTSDLGAKKNLLIDANKYGIEALNNLNQITNPNAIATNSNSNVSNNNSAANNNSTNNGNTASNNNVAGNNNNATNNNATTNSNRPNNTTNNTTGNNTTANTPVIKLKVEGLEVKPNNAYTADKPIPIDEKIPDGLVFKVQIGAFKAPLPNNTFKGLTPVIAQTTPSGYIRYMAGNFEQYGSANAVKNDLRNLGYSDAFVVAYYNGKRINLSEAADKAKAAGQTVEPTANTSAGITANSNVPRNTFTTPTANATNNATDSQPAEVTNELEKMNGLLYTVQIGVYSKQVTRGQLFNLKPIYTEKLPNGLYRYTAGIYNQKDRLLGDKRKVVDLGVKDAFVSAYYNAKRIPFAEGQKLQTENTNLKMETENPIIFGGASSPAINTNNTVDTPTNNTAVTTNATPTPTVAAFTNGVTSGPAPTAENGVKTDEAGISFKVQIGAYKNQVPNEVASKFLNIKTWPVQNVVINGLYIYSIGNFTAASFAKKLKDEAISVGINDAYITVYKDGKKLYGAEATQYLSR